MRKIKEILRLRFECGLSQREIGRVVNVASSTVHDCGQLTRVNSDFRRQCPCAVRWRSRTLKSLYD